jgi:SAM-dependent methyltransferase
MLMQDYLTRFSHLSEEDTLYQIPRRKEFLLREIGRGKRVLDVGCLGGQISRLILERGNEVWGIELNPEAAEVARSRGVRVKVANVEEGLPFEDSGFDVVNAGQLAPQLYDTRAFFREACRVLKPGGVFLLTTPNLNSLDNRVRVLLGGYPSVVGAYPEDHHGEKIRLFNIAKIRELCERTGFAVERIEGVSFLDERPGLTRRVGRAPVAVAGRWLPSLSKLLLVKARKPK